VFSTLLALFIDGVYVYGVLLCLIVLAHYSIKSLLVWIDTIVQRPCWITAVRCRLRGFILSRYTAKQLSCFSSEFYPSSRHRIFYPSSLKMLLHIWIKTDRHCNRWLRASSDYLVSMSLMVFVAFLLLPLSLCFILQVRTRMNVSSITMHRI
jgi:hypothetical protein